MSGLQTELQAIWIDHLQTLELARRRLGEREFEAFLSMLVIVVARLGQEQLEREWRRAA